MNKDGGSLFPLPLWFSFTKSITSKKNRSRDFLDKIHQLILKNGLQTKTRLSNNFKISLYLFWISKGFDFIFQSITLTMPTKSIWMYPFEWRRLFLFFALHYVLYQQNQSWFMSKKNWFSRQNPSADSYKMALTISKNLHIYHALHKIFGLILQSITLITSIKSI